MSLSTKAIVFTAINEIAIQDVTLGECGADDIVCQTLYTFVSPGTELRVLGGNYSSPDDFPLIPGYSAIATVIEVGANVKGFKVGDVVSGRNPKAVPGIKGMWGGQAGHHVYSTKGEDRAVLLPEGGDPFDYVVAEVAAISFRGIEAARAQAGESAVVIGQGMIGSFSAAWLNDRGCRTIVCDIDEGRLDLARKRGAAATVNMKEDSAMERLDALLNGDADIVVESSGVTPGLNAALRLVRKKPQAYGADYKVEPIAFY